MNVNLLSFGVIDLYILQLKIEFLSWIRVNITDLLFQVEYC